MLVLVAQFSLPNVSWTSSTWARPRLETNSHRIQELAVIG
jgi:hypothetical protein